MNAQQQFDIPPGAIENAIVWLQQTFVERVIVARPVPEQHGRGEGLSTTLPPDAVVSPIDKHEVCRILARSDDLGVPVIAYGAGSPLEAMSALRMAEYASTCRA